MLEAIKVIEQSNLSLEDKRNLKEFYLKAFKMYIQALEEGRTPTDVYELIYDDRVFLKSSALRNLGITYKTERILPYVDKRDPLAESIYRLCTVNRSTISFPGSLLELKEAELAELLKEAQESADKDAEIKKRESFNNIPRRGFRRR